jgi:poly(3-hydroxyalkanoate) synthetase
MKLRRRFWVETVSTLVTGVLCVISLICPDWIETVTGWNLDHHNGLVEWAIAGGLFIVTVMMLTAAAIERRRTQVTELSGLNHGIGVTDIRAAL